MKIKIKNFTFNLIEYFYNKINPSFSCFIDKTENFQSIEDFYLHFTPEEHVTIQILNSDDSLIESYDNILFLSVEETLQGQPDGTNKEVFYLNFINNNSLDILSQRNTADIDYIATVLDIELDEG